MITKFDTYRGNYKHLIFDFDGTINNTEQGIVQTFKKVLDIYNIDSTNIDFRKHIGPPLEHSFKQLVGQEKWQQALELYRKIFVSDNAIKMCKLYDGILDTLEKLRGKFSLSIATSKYQPFAEQSVEDLNIKKYFPIVYGQTENRGFKGEILRQLISHQNWDKNSCLMIGDTAYDIEGARANGIDVLAVCYGFETRHQLTQKHPDAIVDTPMEIAQLVLQQQN